MRWCPVLLLILPSLAAGQAPRWGGLEAVAVRPDGKQISVGGQSRTIFFLSPDDLSVTARLWHGARIRELFFTADSKRLIVADDADSLHFYDLDTLKNVAHVEGVRSPTFAPAADLIAVRPTRSAAPSAIRLLSAIDGSEKGVLEFKDRLAAFTLAADGKKLVILTLGQESDERRVPLSETPRALAGLARLEYQQRHDGLTSFLRTVEVPSGKVVKELKLWYTSESESTRLTLAGLTTVVTNFSNVCARISEDGETKLFTTNVVFNYAVGSSVDGKVLVVGGLREGIVALPEGKQARFTLDALPGADEFVTGFSVGPGGTILGVTTSYRLFRLARDGKLEKIVPVY